MNNLLEQNILVFDEFHCYFEVNLLRACCVNRFKSDVSSIKGIFLPFRAFEGKEVTLVLRPDMKRKCSACAHNNRLVCFV